MIKSFWTWTLAVLTFASPVSSRQCGNAVRIVAADAASGSLFGYALAVDGLFLGVGAPEGVDIAGVRVGRAYVFQHQGIGWVQRQVLAPSNGSNGDRFGEAVACSGTTVMVGAPFADGVGSESGSVYVFEFVGGAWVEQSILAASDATPSIAFGATVALDGDLAVVGAPGDFTMPALSGAAYVFERGSGGWVEVAKLGGVNSGGNARFGYAVNIARGRILVGAVFGAGGRGEAYIFEKRGGAWREAARLEAGDGGAGHGFGWDIAGFERMDTIVVGAPFHGSFNIGAAYVFEQERLTGTWIEVQKLVGTTYFDRYMGFSVDAQGHRVVAGSLGAVDPAAVRIFEMRADGTWPIDEDEVISLGPHNTLFGRPARLTPSGGLFVGAVRDDSAGMDAGALWAVTLDALGEEYCCPAALNSTGEWGRLRVLGSRQVEQDELWLGAGYLPRSNVGYFIASDGNGVVQPPGSAGLMCLAGGALRRVLPPVLNTDQFEGGFGLDIGTQNVPGLGAILPGRTWNFQAWYRDNAAGTSNFTDAVSITFE